MSQRHSHLEFARLFAVGVLVAAFAGGARAEKFEYLGTHTLSFSSLGPLEVSVTGTGVAEVGSNGSGHLMTLRLSRHFPGGLLDTAVPVTEPGVSGTIPAVQITGLRINPQVQGGLFAPFPTSPTGTGPLLSQATMPLTGTIRLCILDAGCADAVTLTHGQTTTSGVTGVGVGGAFSNAGTPYSIMWTGQPWTIGTVSISNRTPSGAITTVTAMGFASGPLSNPSSTAQTGGIVQLVTATQVQTGGLPGNNDLSGIIHTLRIEFVPEPGFLLLLGCGALFLGLLGRARLRRD